MSHDDRLLPVLRTLPRTVWVLYVGQFVNRFGTFVHIFLLVWLLDLGYSPQQAGLAVSAYGAGSLFAAMAGGSLADRIGRRETIVLSMFASAATLVALEMASTLPAAIAGALAFGFAGELYRPAAQALLADITTDEDRVVAFAGYRFAINLGFAMGPAIAGFLATRSFTWLFYGDAITSVLFGLLALAWLPKGAPGHDEQEPAAQPRLVEALRADRRFRLFVLAAFLNGLVFVQAFSTFALHVERAGYQEYVYGLLMSLNGGIIVFAEFPVVRWSRIRPATPVMVIGLLLLGVGFGMLAFSMTLWLIAISVAIWTLGEMVVAPVATAHVARISPERLRGRYAGIIGLAFGFANVLAPTLGTFVYGLSVPALWLGCLGLAVAAAWLLVRSERAGHESRRTALATSTAA